MKLPPEYAHLVSTHGIPLSTVNTGSQEIAFPRVIAVQALNCLQGSPIAVAGGDVLKISGGRLEYVYANWYCNRKEGEPAQEYAGRSQRHASEYISKFVALGGYEPLFVLVLNE